MPDPKPTPVELTVRQREILERLARRETNLHSAFPQEVDWFDAIVPTASEKLL
jgi:hypothetical protein